jgi:phenylpropionate dioxygenase-like ring-hydroxylating dioxygenase large terminal subunit
VCLLQDGKPMIERQLWHPVARSEALAAGAPLALALLGEELVLWRDAQGVARAFTDRCPHRGARLSMGRVEGGELECPYHGWRFEGGGRCVAIPALPDFRPPATHRACSHAALEAAGMLWLRLDEGGAAAPALAMLEPAERDPALRKLTVGPYEVATSAPRIVENFLDLSHFGLVHEGWLGDRAHLAQPPYEVHTTADGTLVASGCRAWQPQSNRLSAAGSEVDYRYEVPAPFMAVLSKAPQGQPGYRDVIALLVCPLTPESSRVWFRMALTDFDSSDAEIAAFQDAIFAQDRPVLESQRPRRLPITEAAPVRELHSAADRLSSAYRRMLVARGIAFGIC